MNTRPILHAVRHAGSIMGVLLLVGCLENETQVQELRQLREKLTAAEKKLAAAANKPPAANSEKQEMAQKLQQAEERAAELEKKLKAAESRPPTAPNMAYGSTDSLGLLVDTMEKDLLGKVEALRVELARSFPPTSLLDTTIKRLRPLEKIAAAYDSSITFKIADEAGSTRTLVFPVQPGTDGRWHLPGVAVVEKQIKAFIKPEWPPSVASHGGLHPPMAPLPLPPGYSGKPANADSKNQPVIIKWDSPPNVTPSSQVPPVAASAPAPQNNAVAPPVSATPASASTSRPRVHDPVMPVQQEVQVRFE